MKQVKCKKLGTVTSLTVDKVYDLIDETESRFVLINDKGVQMNYGKNLFHEPTEIPNAAPPARRRGPGRPSNAEVAAERAAAAPAPARVIPVVDQIEVDTSAEMNGGQIKFKIKFSFTRGRELEHASNEIMYSNPISASCGIQSLNGIDELSRYINTVRDAFTAYVRANTQHFTLGNIDIANLFDEISVAFIQDLISVFQGENADIKAGVLIISTTRNSIENQPCLGRALNLVSPEPIAVHNPNSGNNILMWNVPVEA